MDPRDLLYLERAYELAERGVGNTSPNPAVGAVVVRDGAIVGEGYHHRAGEPHAEVNALREAGDAARGATLYVSLEPCNHQGRTPACTLAVTQAGIARVVAGTTDPNPRTAGSGITTLAQNGVRVEVSDDERARAIVEPFARAVRSDRPFVTLKMAMSLDGFVAAQQGRQDWLTGEEARAFVRELRIAHDAVVVGAGTVRIDNPQLTVRPPHHRLRDYVRIVACETDSVDPASSIFEPQPGYARTVVLAPSGVRRKFDALQGVADVLFAGEDSQPRLDLARAFRALKERDISSVLCEGGPTMAAQLLALGLVDRFHWLIAPRLLRSDNAVPVLAGTALSDVRGLRFDRVERLGVDVVVSGTVTCLAD